MTRIGPPGRALEVEVSGGGPALLLLHGFTGSAASWSTVAASQGAHHLVIVPDLLGHGRSDAPGDPASYVLDGQADVLASLLATLEAEPADVVGYSMGARLALALALDHPEAVRSLVLESPSAGLASSGERARRRAADERWAGQLERDGLTVFVDAWQAQPLFASQAALPADTMARLRAERLGHDARGLAASLRGAGQGVMAPLHARLGDIRVPTLVMAGGLDLAGLARAREVASAIPGAHVEVFDDAGHAPHLERPSDFIDRLTAFLASSQPIPSH